MCDVCFGSGPLYLYVRGWLPLDYGMLQQRVWARQVGVVFIMGELRL